MRLLVTGGAGYIGGFATRLLDRLGHEVVVVDDLSSGRPENVGGAELVTMDVGDPRMRALLTERRIEGVLHFAARKSVAESWTQPDLYREVNVTGTATLLDAMARAGVGVLVYSSSCSIYGDVERLPVDESASAAPMNPYAETKWLAEREIERAAREANLRFVNLRYFNAAGAELDGSRGEPLEQAENLVPMVMKAALGMLPSLAIYGTDYPTPDGTAVRDYVHVLDLAEVHARAIDYLRAGGPSVPLNVGTGSGTSVREVVRVTEEVSGRHVPVVETDRRPGDPAAIWADVRLAERTLGWRSKLGIDEILSSAWRWHSGGGDRPLNAQEPTA
jgi:UDP-glucose-4-epimerase GalE